MNKPQISFEFFPPKTQEGVDKLDEVRKQLHTLQPVLFSVTFGAGGVTQTGTLQTALRIHQAGQSVAPHISCIGSSRQQLAEILQTYQQSGIRDLVALRGDLPSGVGTRYGELQYANELVSFIREQTGDWFHIRVAAYPEFHPQARSPHDDLKHFANKIKAGANSAITQYFFNKDAYFRFVDEINNLNINTSITPGIMPITNSAQLIRFSEICGTDVPRWIRLRLLDYGDDIKSIRSFGEEVITRLCQDLINGGAPGLHFYTLNQSTASTNIIRNLNII